MPLILRILAFGGALIAGVLCIVFAIKYETYALFAWAVAAFFGGITGFLYAQEAKPTGSIDGPRVGGIFKWLPDWVTWIDFGLVAIAIVVTVLLR